MFGSEHIQHADNFLKAIPEQNSVKFTRLKDGKACCALEFYPDGKPEIAIGSGDSLLDALKDALQKAGLDK